MTDRAAADHPSGTDPFVFAARGSGPGQVLANYSFIEPATRLATGKSLILFVVAWVAGIIWYFYWKARSEKQGIDVSITFGELPPE